MKKNFVYNLLLTGSNLLFPLITFPYLSRILGAEGLGVCNFIISYGQNYLIIAALGIPFYGSREIAKLGNDKGKRSKLFFELLSTHLSLTFILLAVYVASIFLSEDFKNYTDIALIGGSLILFNVFSIEWLFSGVNDFKYITIRSLIIRALSVISIFLFVKKKDDFKMYFIIMVCTVFFTVLTDVYYARKFISRKIVLKLKDILIHIKPIFILGIYMVLLNIYAVLPATLLGFLSSKSAVGYYYGANRIVRMVISIFSALTTVIIPRVNL
ncbi:MAG: oligosaccharide flippase family protein, partial [Ferruginibacter sp.]